MSQLPVVNTYDFNLQKAQGALGERRLDEFFAGRYSITEATDEQQCQGIDRIFWDKGTTELLFVEYKTDARANQTQKAFIEMETNGKGKGSGWALTSKAAVLIYYIPGEGAEVAYWVRFSMLRIHLPRWTKRFRQVSIPNAEYDTVGLLVPLSQFERIAERILSL